MRPYKWDGDAAGKDSNPKDAIGSRKVGLSMIPRPVLYERALAMLGGSLKYARHNYRIAGVRASVYRDATDRHLDAWWEGEDIDEESGLNHITKAIASLAVMRDAMINGMFVDDRPPKVPLETMRGDLQDAVDGIFERLPEALPAYLEGDQFPGRFGSGAGQQKKKDD
ncbi:MAG: hypothetical protein IH926_00005 [Proteobacteria bacterium]|nr:hypothetical protein [Pseudomonadota bacterium]